MKVGDLEPVLEATLKTKSGDVVNLGTAESVKIRLAKPYSSPGAPTDTGVTIIDAAAGRVDYAWQSGDTDTPGTLRIEFVVDWGSGRLQTFPGDDSNVEVEVEGTL